MVAPIVGKAGLPSKGDSVDWELPRKAYHTVQGLVIVYLYARYPYMEPHDFLPFLLPPFLLYFYIDHRRLSSPSLNTRMVAILGKTMRPAERLATRLTSSSAYMAGILMVLSLWPRDRAVLACLYLAVVDTAAAFGGRAGRMWLGEANVQVGLHVDVGGRNGVGMRKSDKTVCGFVAAAVVAGCIYNWLQSYRQVNIGSVQLLVAGLIGGVAEGITVGGVDDDLSLPLLAGMLLSLFKSFLSLP